MADSKVIEPIIKVGTKDAITSIGDLRDNIRKLKKQLNEVQIDSAEGWQQYQDKLEELKINQNALKDAMHATSTSFDEVVKSAASVGIAFDKDNKLIDKETISYNALVHEMANLKEAWRATTDEAERANIGEQINEVNNRLKELDASVGSHVRNVGNYKSAWEGLPPLFDDIVPALNKVSKNIVGISEDIEFFKKGFSKMGNLFADLKKGFDAASSGAEGMVNPVRGATNGLKALSATPVIAILGVLATILEKVIDNLNTSEKSANKMTKSLSVFGGIADGVTKVIQGLGSAVAWVTEKMSNLYTSIFGVTEAMQKRMDLAQKEIDLAEQERKTLVESADAQLRIAELKAKSSEKDRYTAQERLKFLAEAGELEKQISDQAYQDLKNQYEIIKSKNELTASSADDLQKEAEAYAAMVKAQTDYFNKVKEVNSQMKSARDEEKKSAREAAKEANDALKARINAEKDLIDQELQLIEKGTDEQLKLQIQRRDKEYQLAVAEAKTKVKDAQSLHKTLILLEKKYNKDIEILQRQHQIDVEKQQNLHLQNLADIYEQGTLNYLTAIRDLRKQELDQIQREEGETIDEFNARRIKAQKAYNDSVRAINEKNIADSTAELRLALAKQEQGTEGYYVGMMSLAENYWKTLTKNAGESDVEFAIRQAEAFKQYQDSVNEYLDYGTEQERLSFENRMNALQEGSIAYLDAAIELKKFELDSLHQMEGESNEEFRARELEAQKAYDDAIKASFQGRVAVMQNYASTISSVLGAIGDLYDNDSKTSQKAANKLKAVRIASATIDTISGAVGAFTSAAANPGGVQGMILGAANAAAVTATGMAQIAKIKSTNISGATASVGGSSITPPSVPMEMPMTRNITSASEEDRLNRMASDQRVKLVMSDLEVAEEQIRVQTEESSF